MYICKLCQKEFGKYSSLSRHMGRTHKINTIQFYVDYYLNRVWPDCKCGCGEKVSWSRQLKGFRSYNAGHQSRIHNNWGHNQKSIEKSSETRRQQYANGERHVWNEGLTKENDERVKNNGIQSSIGINSNIKELKRRSESMSKNRLNGIIPTLYGSKHSQWNGGTSRLRDMIYSDIRLYKEWKYPILERDHFNCVECGIGGHLHIHHNKEKMCEIVKKYLIDISEDMLEIFDIKRELTNKIVDYHIKNNVSGVTLCNTCHEKYHPSLNFD